MQLSLSTAIVALAALVGTVLGETHTVRFNNLCGIGHPILAQNGSILSNGADYTANGPLVGAVAYLQNGDCGLDGQKCTVIETTLANRNEINPEGSLTKIDVDSPRAFTFVGEFTYSNGCDDIGARCDGPQCPAANVLVVCEEDDVDLSITFCD